MNQSYRRPQGMIAAENETITSSTEHCAHAMTIGFDPGGALVMKVTAVDCSPKIAIEFEIGAAPILTHRAKHHLEVPLRFGMSAIQHVPWTAPPATKGHP